MDSRSPSPAVGHPRRRAYTLTEVLVVCGIIALLASMMAPSIVRTIHNGRRARCAGNLRQVGIVFTSYAHEHQDRYPQSVPASEGGVREAAQKAPVAEGVLALSPEVFRVTADDFKLPQVLTCPATKLHVPSIRAIAVSNLSYCVNLYPKPGNPGTVVAADASLGTYWRQFQDFPRYATNVDVRFTQDRHVGRGNSLFGDGHVENGTRLKLERPAQPFPWRR